MKQYVLIAYARLPKLNSTVPSPIVEPLWRSCERKSVLVVHACTARVAVVVVVVVCVCVSVHGSNLLTQLRDKLVILTGSASWSPQKSFGVFCIMASFRRYRAIAFPILTSTRQSDIFYTRKTHSIPEESLAQPTTQCGKLGKYLSSHSGHQVYQFSHQPPTKRRVTPF